MNRVTFNYLSTDLHQKLEWTRQILQQWNRQFVNELHISLRKIGNKVPTYFHFTKHAHAHTFHSIRVQMKISIVNAPHRTCLANGSSRTEWQPPDYCMRINKNTRQQQTHTHQRDAHMDNMYANDRHHWLTTRCQCICVWRNDRGLKASAYQCCRRRRCRTTENDSCLVKIFSIRFKCVRMCMAMASMILRLYKNDEP